MEQGRAGWDLATAAAAVGGSESQVDMAERGQCAGENQAYWQVLIFA
jgi:hypothetical protein